MAAADFIDVETKHIDFSPKWPRLVEHLITGHSRIAVVAVDRLGSMPR